MKWGFTLKGTGQPLVNARTETAAVKPSFRKEWLSHRCIVPASWYFEWEHFTDPSGKKKTGSKYCIQPAGAHITYLCGLYRFEDEYPVFTVLTREPSDELRRIHDRMPLILPENLINDWIRPDSKPEELISYALTDMIYEKA
jgi:putative SOS response-associated peptidase YedK